MTTTALIPLAGAAAGVLASGAARSVSSGLSFLAELAGGGETAASEGAAIEDQPTTAEQRKSLDQALQDFVKRLRERLLLAGVAADRPMQLQQEPWGSIAVSEDHPQKDHIEAALAADPLLASEFHQLADQYRQLAELEGQNLSRADAFQMTVQGVNGAAGFVR